MSSDCKLWQFPAKNWPCGFLKLFNDKQTQKHISANQGCKLNFCRTRSSRYLISYNYSRITGKLYFKQNQPARSLTDLETASRFFLNFAFKNERLKELKYPFFVLIQPILPSRGIIICLLSRNPKHMSTSKSNLKHKIILNTEKKIINMVWQPNFSRENCILLHTSAYSYLTNF